MPYAGTLDRRFVEDSRIVAKAQDRVSSIPDLPQNLPEVTAAARRVAEVLEDQWPYLTEDVREPFRVIDRIYTQHVPKTLLDWFCAVGTGIRLAFTWSKRMPEIFEFAAAVDQVRNAVRRATENEELARRAWREALSDTAFAGAYHRGVQACRSGEAVPFKLEV